jgi:hypothetical protein
MTMHLQRAHSSMFQQARAQARFAAPRQQSQQHRTALLRAAQTGTSVNTSSLDENVSVSRDMCMCLRSFTRPSSFNRSPV